MVVPVAGPIPLPDGRWGDISQTLFWEWSLAEGAHTALLGQELSHNPLCSREKTTLGPITALQQGMEGEVLWFPALCKPEMEQKSLDFLRFPGEI